MAEPRTPPSRASARQHVVATAGHVDHGKSALVRALTGMEPDRLAEERRRGLTLDLGYAWTQAPPPAEGDLAFVDVPGHERFVATMLAGASAAPAALLVVAADDGWSAQSTEHRDVLDLLGVPAVAVVVSKADTVDRERVAEVVDAVTRECRGTSLEGAPVVVVDALSGRGIGELRDTLGARLSTLPAPPDRGRPRVWVDRSFPVAGAGTVVTGTLVEGALRVGDAVRVLPDDLATRIRGIQTLARPVDVVAPGSRVALNLAGVDHRAVSRGDVVVGGAPWRTTLTADLWVRTLPGRELASAGAWHLHVGSARTTVRVLPVSGPVGGHGTVGEGAVRVVLGEAVPLVAGDRVVLRDAGRRAVVAGGVVADPSARVRPRGRAARWAHAQRLRELADDGRDERLVGLVRLAGGRAEAGPLLADAGLADTAALPEEVRRLAHHLVLEECLDRLTTAIRGLGPGVHQRTEVARLQREEGIDGSLEPALTAELVERGTLVRSGGGYALPEHVDEARAAQDERAGRVLAELERDPLRPPDLEELARREGLDHRELAALIQSGRVVRLGRVAFARTAVEQAVARLRELGAGGRPFTASEAREAWGTTRRYAIPLLEHLDRTGVTRFDGQHRRLT